MPTLKKVKIFMQQQIFDMLLKEDEITWQSIIYDLVKTEQINPWDVDVSILTKKYITILKKLKEMDCRVSGKVLLAAAILLKIKSKRLINDDLGNLDRLISSVEQYEEDEFYEELESEFLESGRIHNKELEKPKLIPKTPQPRKRKVSLFDLMDALEKALEVKKRRVIRSAPVSKVVVPKKGVDLTYIMKQVYRKIIDVFDANGKKKIKFSSIIPDTTKEGKVLTFIPMLHLTNQRKIDIFQDHHCSEIEIELLKRMKESQIENELAIAEE